MDEKKLSHRQSLVDMCDRLIEDAQTTLMNQIEHKNEVVLNLSDYTSYKETLIKEEIMDYLMSQEIRLYEDECDENDTIINSREVFTKIFEKITIEADGSELMSINLFFSPPLMDLLT